MKPYKVDISNSDRKDKRLKAIFYDKEGQKIRTIHFGSGKPTGKGAFPDHKDTKIRRAWIARHQVREDWENPMTAGSLSRFVLWGEKPSIKAGIREFKKRFNLK